MPHWKIDIGVGGRFHADYMARALLAAGHDVTLFTSFPASRFPALDASRVRSTIWPEIVFRALKKLGLENTGDLYKMRAFGRAMARKAASAKSGRRRSDLFIGWSSFSEETLRGRHAERQVIVRDSAHILFQDQVLSREFARLSLRYPSREPCIRREMAEYELADRILVPSEFARRTFVDKGVSPDKLDILRLGVNVAVFRPDTALESRLPLRVVYFGTLSVQKGVHHLLEATRGFSSDVLRLSLVGHVSPEFEGILSRYSHAKRQPAMDHAHLAVFLRNQDVFVFPTLHDGFGQVVPQAMASGILPIVTDACGASELVRDGENGYVVPAGDPQVLRDRLEQLTSDLATVKRLRQAAARIGETHSWASYERTLVSWVDSVMSQSRGGGKGAHA